MSDTKSSEEPRRAVVASDQAGWRLDRFLAAALGDISRSRLQQLLAAGAVTHTRKTIRDGNFRVKPGEAYTVSVPPPLPAAPLGQDIPLAVVYEDSDLIVIDKPAGPGAKDWSKDRPAAPRSPASAWRCCAAAASSPAPAIACSRPSAIPPAPSPAWSSAGSKPAGRIRSASI